MKKITVLISLTTILAVACSKPPQAQQAGASEVYPIAKPQGKELQLDTTKSVIKWIGTKVTGRHNGTVALKSGSIFVDGDKITAGKFVIDMPSITVLDLSGEYKAKLEKHLKSEDFFYVENFPEAIFEIASVTPGANADRVKGNLTIRGITHGIEFDAHIEREKKVVKKAHAIFNIDRQKWKVAYPGKPDDLISDTVNIEIELFVK